MCVYPRLDFEQQTFGGCSQSNPAINAGSEPVPIRTINICDVLRTANMESRMLVKLPEMDNTGSHFHL
jgi:hypothetical protein